jgi:hypothetical protein
VTEKRFGVTRKWGSGAQKRGSRRQKKGGVVAIEKGFEVTKKRLGEAKRGLKMHH